MYIACREGETIETKKAVCKAFVAQTHFAG